MTQPCDPRPQCVGILGWIFGHKFVNFRMTELNFFCLRCGMAAEASND